MPSPYDYADSGGYARARADWADYPTLTTPVRAADLDQIEQAIEDLKATVFNVKDFDAAGDSATDDTAAINAACTACRAAGGGIVYFPHGQYTVTATIDASACLLVGSGGYPRNDGTETTMIRHNFNGTCFSFGQTGAIVVGGGMRDMLIYNLTGKTGSAIVITANGTASAIGRFFFDRVVVTGDVGFTRAVDIDGSAAANGCRQTFFSNCQFFGSVTSGETVRLNKVVACHFANCSIYQAPDAGTAGLKILSTFSSNVYWVGGVIGGAVSTEAAGNAVATQSGLTLFGTVEGAVTCVASSARNVFSGQMHGTFTNSGDLNTNYRTGDVPAVRVTKTGTQSLTNATLTALTWDAEDFDDLTMHDNVTNNTRLTCKRAGRYRIHATVVFDVNATGNRAISFRVNAGTRRGGARMAANPTASEDTAVTASTTWTLAVGDYVECEAYQVSGGALNVDVSDSGIGIPSHFGMELLT